MGALGTPVDPAGARRASGVVAPPSARRADIADPPVARRITTQPPRLHGFARQAWLPAICLALLVGSVTVVARQPRLWPVALVAAVGAFVAMTTTSSRRAVLGSRALNEDLIAALRQADAVVSSGDLDGGWVEHVEGDIEAIMGYRLDEWRQLDFASLIHPDDVSTYWIDRDSVRSGTIVDRTGRLRHADGRWIWIREVMRVGTDAKGRRTVRGFFLDVTS